MNRYRIREILSDGETVTVTLKNRANKQTEDEEEWYEKAFGAKQNIMSVKVNYEP